MVSDQLDGSLNSLSRSTPVLVNPGSCRRLDDLYSKASPCANICFLKGHALAQKGFRCFDPSSRSRRPGMLPSMSTSSSTPPYFSRRAYWISIFWIFFTSGFSCAFRASGESESQGNQGRSPLLSSWKPASLF